MREQIDRRLADLARRAGISGAPPAVVAAALVVCLLVVLYAAWRWWPRDTAIGSPIQMSAGAGSGGSVLDPASASASPSAVGVGESSTPSATAAVCVHIVGAVRRPGVYELQPGARVADAVEAAGGLMGNAAQAGINLARVVADGEQIPVPTTDELSRGVLGGTGGGTGGGSATTAQGAGDSVGTQGLVNINTADAAALDTLPGVGPSTAEKIVADRESNGPFSSADDLGRVAGIGPKKLEELKPRVCVR